MINWRKAVRYSLITGLKLALVVAVALVFYLIYLDSMLSQRFASNRYQAPALIYGRALTLAPGAVISQQQVETELAQLRYREVTQVDDSGEYQTGKQQLHIYRRPFDFPGGPEMAQAVKVLFKQNRIDRILSWPNGREIAQFRLESPLIARLTPSSQEDRLLVGLELVPNLLVETLLLVEDRNFYHHSGISPTGIARAALANIAAGRTVQGGSTLTQQLVKNLYLTRQQTLWRKIREALMALVIDFRFSKNEILETYLNEVYFGQDKGSAIHGIGLASAFYFGKQVQELEPAEIALLVGIVKGPSYYNPRRYPERAQERRDLILQQMFEQDMINKSQYLSAVNTPVSDIENTSLVARSRPHYVDLVQRELNEIVLPDQWQRTGLRVFTYLDPQAQNAAEKALQTVLPQLTKDPDIEGAMVVADYHRAGIKALVGGRHSQLAGFNRALLAQRQVGSLIKPFIYATALESPERYSLATPLSDELLQLKIQGGEDWVPRNYDGEYLDAVPLYDAFVQSRNLPAVHLGLELGIPLIAQQLRHAGVTTPIAEYPSLTLGAVPLSPVAVTRMFATLANDGYYQPLRAVQAITTHSGMLVYERDIERGRRVFTEAASYLVQYAMRGVVSEGTGRALTEAFPNQRLAGKSGTTNDLKDSWFVTIDGRDVTTVWLGRDDNESIGMTGSTGALPVVRSYLTQTGVVPAGTDVPDAIATSAFHRQTGVQVPLACSDARRFPAVKQVLAEDIDCSGEQKEKSWLERLFGG